MKVTEVGGKKDIYIYNIIQKIKKCIYSGDPEIGPPMGLTESGPILESVWFVKPANYEWRDTSQSDIKVDY